MGGRAYDWIYDLATPRISTCDNFPSFGFAAVLINPIENFAHIFDLFEQSIGHINGAFLSCGKREAIAGASVNFNNLSGQFVLLLQNEAGEISRIFQLRDHNAFDGDTESFEDT